MVAEIAVSAVAPERAGAAAAIPETSNEIGNALGISILGSLAALWFRLSGPDKAATLNETRGTPGLAATTIRQADQAFLTGMHLAAAVAGLLTFFVGLLAVYWLPKTLPK